MDNISNGETSPANTFPLKTSTRVLGITLSVIWFIMFSLNILLIFFWILLFTKTGGARDGLGLAVATVLIGGIDILVLFPATFLYARKYKRERQGITSTEPLRTILFAIFILPISIFFVLFFFKDPFSSLLHLRWSFLGSVNFIFLCIILLLYFGIRYIKHWNKTLN